MLVLWSMSPFAFAEGNHGNLLPCKSVDGFFVFYKIYIICRKKYFYMEQKVLDWKFFLLKKTFFTVKNTNENVKKYISLLKNFLYRKCLCYK